MNKNIQVSPESITNFCERWEVVELALFGSVLGDNFGPDSDVDILVKFDSLANHTLFDFVHMQDELSEIFNSRVGLVSRAAVEQSRNYIRRKAILESAETIYAK